MTDLAASRIGDGLDLTWTTPSRSTDDLPLAGRLSAEICEAAVTAANACQLALTLDVAPGPSRANLPLSPTTRSGPPVLLVVRVRIRNAVGRSADLSGPAFTAVGSAPPPVADLRASPIQSGARIEWARMPGSGAILLHRTLLTPPPAAAGRPLPTETELQSADRSMTDPGGMLDRSALEGSTYRYTAQRLRSVTLDGHPVQLLSLPSLPVTVRILDVFPPAAPTGLASVPGIPGETTPTIELSWEPNPEPDLAGYRVDRAELLPSPSPAPSNSTWTRLTPNLLTIPAFQDAAVTAGHRYLYRILAVDTAGNQGLPSTPIEETAATP